MSGTALFRLEGLTKHFSEGDTWLNRLRPDRRVKTVRAVDDVDLTVRDGETLGLVGESGCGKSTLARTALRLLEPTSGHIYFRGEDVAEYSASELRSFRSHAQMIFQDPFASLNPRYTVRRTLLEPMEVHDVGDSDEDRTERARDLVTRVGLTPDHLDRYPHEFSGGQRQRVSIARALAVEPELIVADEPVSALDVSVQAQILNLLDELREEYGIAMLFISHDLSVIRRICDRVAVMYLGEIVERAPHEALFETPRHPYTQALFSSIPVPNPAVERDRIRLTGDVPTPIDPPSGCRFHPRCPKVIQSDEWSGSQDAWRAGIQLKKQVADGTVSPAAVREQLSGTRDAAVTDDDVVDAIYAEATDQGAVAFPSDAESVVRDAIVALVAGDRSDAVERLDETFSTPCETAEPRVVDVGADHDTRCHLYDPEQPGSAEPQTIMRINEEA